MYPTTSNQVANVLTQLAYSASSPFVYLIMPRVQRGIRFLCLRVCVCRLLQLLNDNEVQARVSIGSSNLWICKIMLRSQSYS